MDKLSQGAPLPTCADVDLERFGVAEEHGSHGLTVL